MAVSILLLMEMVLEYSYHQVRFSMIDVSILLLMEMVLESYQFFRMSLVSASFNPSSNGNGAGIRIYLYSIAPRC